VLDACIDCRAHACIQAHNGLVWVGTEAQILRFDAHKRELVDAIKVLCMTYTRMYCVDV
jgi:hypothetical protein